MEVDGLATVVVLLGGEAAASARVVVVAVGDRAVPLGVLGLDTEPEGDLRPEVGVRDPEVGVRDPEALVERALGAVRDIFPIEGGCELSNCVVSTLRFLLTCEKKRKEGRRLYLDHCDRLFLHEDAIVHLAGEVFLSFDSAIVLSSRIIEFNANPISSGKIGGSIVLHNTNTQSWLAIDRHLCAHLQHHHNQYYYQCNDKLFSQ